MILGSNPFNNHVIFQEKRRFICIIIIFFFPITNFYCNFIHLFYSNDGNDDNQIRQVTINGMVATSSTGRRTPQANFQHPLATVASNISG